MKSVHHFWFGFSTVKSCLSLFSNTLWGFPGVVPGLRGGQSNAAQAPCSYRYGWLQHDSGIHYVPDKLSCCDRYQRCYGCDRCSESAHGRSIFAYNNPPSGVSGSCNKYLGRFPAASAASGRQTLYDVVGWIDKPLIDFLCKECRCFFLEKILLAEFFLFTLKPEQLLSVVIFCFCFGACLAFFA